MVAHTSQNMLKALSPCCCAQLHLGKYPREFCAEVLGESVFCELHMNVLQVAGMLTVCWGRRGRDPGDWLWWNDVVACVFAGVSLLLGTGGFPKVQMRGTSHFSESLLHGAHLEQVWSLGQLSLIVQWELDRSLSSLREEKKKIFLPQEYLSVNKTSTAWTNDPLPPHCRMCSYAFCLLMYLKQMCVYETPQQLQPWQNFLG